MGESRALPMAWVNRVSSVVPPHTISASEMSSFLCAHAPVAARPRVERILKGSGNWARHSVMPLDALASLVGGYRAKSIIPASCSCSRKTCGRCTSGPGRPLSGGHNNVGVCIQHGIGGTFDRHGYSPIFRNSGRLPSAAASTSRLCWRRRGSLTGRGTRISGSHRTCACGKCRNTITPDPAAGAVLR
jgi:hypothetical protein